MDTTPDARTAFAVDVVARLQRVGHRALWAGGCVRDLLLGLVPSDYDVATDATPEQVMRLFLRTVPVGVSFGVVRVLGPRAAGEVEVATFRSDGAYVDGRRPESVTFGTPEVDASRRDFTINGMFLDPMTDQIWDFVGGKADLTNRVLRAIGDPAARFTEDKLRLLRAVRFAARFGMTIEPATRAALMAMADLVKVVAPERIAQELRKMLLHRTRPQALDMARDVGLVRAVLPPLADVEESRWAEMLRVLEYLPKGPTFPLAFAALLREIAPVHADSLARDLRLANTERDRATWLIANQHALVAPTSLRPFALKRLLAEPGIDELLDLHRAIALATTGDAAHVDYCDWYRRELPAGPLDPPPLITGADLKAEGLQPGPRFKQLLEDVRVAQLNGEIATREDAIARARTWLDRGMPPAD
jgi:poly(A) polymerase